MLAYDLAMRAERIAVVMEGLDDYYPYINLGIVPESVVRRLAEIWGITPREWCSAPPDPLVYVSAVRTINGVKFHVQSDRPATAEDFHRLGGAMRWGKREVLSPTQAAEMMKEG